jgi:hypothetical protein
MLTDITGAQGPDYRIDNGMGQDIRIRMPFKPEGIGYLYSPKYQRTSFNKPMNIISKTNPKQIYSFLA